MKISKQVVVILSFSVLFIVAIAASAFAAEKADYVFKNGAIYTIDSRNPTAQAVAVTGSGTAIPTIEFEKTGEDIQVKPIITPDGYIRLEIKLKQMILNGRAGPGQLDPPIIDERDANTNVIVKNNNTVVLGGLREQNRTELTYGVPWVQDIPLIGWLFKNKNNDKKKTELVLMVTPQIIADKVTMTDKEKFWYDRIDNDWHLPDYFFEDDVTAGKAK